MGLNLAYVTSWDNFNKLYDPMVKPNYYLFEIGWSGGLAAGLGVTTIYSWQTHRWTFDQIYPNVLDYLDGFWWWYWPFPLPRPGGDHPDEFTGACDRCEVGFPLSGQILVKTPKIEWRKGVLSLFLEKQKYDWAPYEKYAQRINSKSLLKYIKYKRFIEEYLNYRKRITIDENRLAEIGYNSWNNYIALMPYRHELRTLFENISSLRVISTGFYDNFYSLSTSFNEIVSLISFKAPLYEMKKYSVLIIPTGGLYGLDSDEIFRAKLEKFVSEGGVLIVFAQQRGYEYRALPGGELGGYGWAEDISCTWGTVEISQHHPAFAGQGSLRVGANIDGYFTQWPENARILMTKRSSRWPVIIEYTYGKGRVIAMTLYTDWAYAHGQAARSEVALLRDLLAYARKPQVLPEYVPGDIARIPVNVSNRGNVSAREVVFTIVDPEKNVLANVSMNLSLAPGESRRVEFEYLIPQKTGIYWVDYALVDASGNVTQVTYEAERFAVSRYVR